MTMRWTAAAGIAAVLAGGAARAQDGAQPQPETGVETSAEAAEEAFLRAWFRERELKDFAAAEKAYAAVAETKGAPREVIGRALVGRARCLRALGREEEAASLLARAGSEFADVPEVLRDARAARRPGGGEVAMSLEMRIRESLARETDWRDATNMFGARGVPILRELLRDESPQVVFRAAACLASMDDTAAASAVLSDADKSTYPAQARAAVREYTSRAALRQMIEMDDPEFRSHALQRAVYDWGDEVAFAKVLDDPALTREVLGRFSFSENYGEFLAAALARGGDARAQALATLRQHANHPNRFDLAAGFQDLPRQVLEDSDAVEAIAATLPPSATLPQALVDVMLANPSLRAQGIRHALRSGAPDFDLFVGAVARAGFGEWVNLPQDPDFAAALLRILGPRPSPEKLRNLAAAWPPIRMTPHDLNRFRVFVYRLLGSEAVDEAGVLAFHEGLRFWQHEQALIGALTSAPNRGFTLHPWAKRLFFRALEHSTAESVRSDAAWGLLVLQQTLGDEAGLVSDIPAIVEFMGRGGSAHLVQVLKALGRPGIEALRAALPSHPHPDVIIDGLLEMDDAASAPAIAEKIRAPKDEDLATSATKALVKFRGDAAKDDLAAAIRADGGRFAKAVLCDIEPLSAAVRRDLMLTALEHAPGVAQEAFPSADEFAPEDARRIVLAALASPSAKDRSWATGEAEDLLDFALWDPLVAAAQDADADVREYAREALRAIRDKETELAAFRAMGRERQTRERIEKLLASNLPRDRRAGVAAIAATGLAGLVDELIRLAAEDPDPEVADDARQALLAMARAPAPGGPVPQKPDDGK